jgi:hypothetical protein
MAWSSSLLTRESTKVQAFKKEHTWQFFNQISFFLGGLLWNEFFTGFFCILIQRHLPLDGMNLAQSKEERIRDKKLSGKEGWINNLRKVRGSSLWTGEVCNTCNRVNIYQI